MQFGDNLRKLRKEKGLSQEQLSKNLKISRRIIGYYETNQRFPKDPKVLINIANFFNVSIDYLLGRKISLDIYMKEIPEISKYMKVITRMKKEHIPLKDFEKIIKIYKQIKEIK